MFKVAIESLRMSDQYIESNHIGFSNSEDWNPIENIICSGKLYDRFLNDVPLFNINYIEDGIYNTILENDGTCIMVFIKHGIGVVIDHSDSELKEELFEDYTGLETITFHF